MTKLQIEYVNLLKKNLNKNSKFYKEDLESLKTIAKSKIHSELKEIIQRQIAINNVSDKEISKNCQFSGLLKLGK